MTVVLDGTGADELDRLGNQAFANSSLSFVEFGKRQTFAGVFPQVLALFGARGEPGQPFGDVGQETGFALFAVANDIDTGVGLPVDDVRDSATDQRLEVLRYLRSLFP